jgi:inorganic pyrophosphatase
MSADEHFWTMLRKLVATSEIVIDRPKGSTHPRYPDLIYPLDYGYLEGTRSGDGAGIDVWVGSLPGKEVTGVVVSVDAQKRDVEIKALVACTPEEAQVVLAFHNDGEQAAILIEREEEQGK